MGSRFALVALLLCHWGCGGGETDAGGAAGGRGPQQLPDLELWGYLRNDPTGLANESELGPLSFDSIRQSTDRSHALIHVSGFT